MATPDLSPPADASLPSALQDGLLRAFFGMAAAVSVLGAVAALALDNRLAPGARLAMVVGYLALALVAVAGLRQPAGQAGRWMPLQVLGGLAVIGGVGAVSGWGLQTPGLLFFSLLVCLGNSVCPPRVAWLSTVGALCCLVALGIGERLGWLPPDLDGPPLATRLIAHSAGVITGTLIGRAVANLLRQHLLETQAREQRFSTLLGIAASAYWETDATLRLSRVFWRNRQGQFVPQPAMVGRWPWELVAAVPGAPDGDALRLAMLARTPAHELPVCWQQGDGQARHCLVSGEPRMAEDGSFAGYWGVLRDTTAEQQARQALRRSQSLLAQVVSLSPDVITLTDLHTGRYVMVSDSFCQLMGCTAADVVGRTSVEVGVWRNSADRERLVQAVRRDGSVQDLYLEFNVKLGRVVALMISGTRFQSEGQDYLLLNGRDVSEMARVRREREAILANASVGIAFLRQRRFELANAPFEQMFGWQPGTLVGQGSGVLCPGEHDAAHARMIDELTPALRRGEAVDLERAARRRDGTVFRLRLRAKAIDPSDLRDHGIILIAEDVTAARQAEQALADARDAAEAASRAKSAFLANTSHEIRTPLNGLLGLARLARQPGLAPALRQQYVEQIGDCAELLAMVITDILDVAKIEAGKLRLEAAPFDLHALLQALQRSHAALAAEQGLDFDTQLDAALPRQVLGDALRLRQILGNLLHNALKFTAAGSIRLLASPLPGERVRFEVHDTGPGIDAATQARLFEPFSQADASITRRYGGTGLGLAICRELATLMGGSVGMDSAPGRGSVFHVELPLPALPDSALPHIAAPAGAARLQGRRVLLVEDNEVNMLIATALLTQWGVQVTPAAGGQQALDEVARAAAAGRMFDAVLMDLQMPGLSGFQATEQLRRRHGPAELPVIALTAAALASEREQAERIGMNDFLTKPIDPLRLREALLRVLVPLHGAAPA